MTMKNLIFIYYYNEIKTIKMVENQINQSIHKVSPCNTEILIVNDGSTDGSQINITSPLVKNIILSKNKGVCNAIKLGIAHATENNFTHMILFPANGRVHFNFAIKVLHCQLKNPLSYITTSRFNKLEKRFTLKTIMAIIFNKALKLTFSIPYNDVTSTLRSFPLNISKNIHYHGLYIAEHELHMNALNEEMEIIELDIKIDTPKERNYSYFNLHGMVEVFIIWFRFGLTHRLKRKSN